MSRQFAQSGASWHAPKWKSHLRSYAARDFDYLEIGSCEGGSAEMVAEGFPGAHLTCVDLWPDEKMQETFLRNTSAHSARMRVLRGRSTVILDQLTSEGQIYDVIYIDGAHNRDTVFTDSAQAWPLLKVGGVLIWDDYHWHPHVPSKNRPGPAIDLFLTAFAPCITEIERSSQVFIRKTSEWPKARPPISIPSLSRRFLRHIKSRRF